MQGPTLRYSHFRTNVFPQYSDLFHSLANGQNPPICLITCADSRIMPEMFLQSDPGEIFTIRNAGNLVPAWGEAHSGVAGSVEYAVAAVKVKHLVVCGHSGCGAIREVLEQANTETLPALTAWLRHAGPSPRWLAGMLRDTVGVSHEHKLHMLIEANVMMQISNLMTYPVVREAVQNGSLELHGWVYDIPTGKLRALNQQVGVFEPIPHTHGELLEIA